MSIYDFILEYKIVQVKSGFQEGRGDASRVFFRGASFPRPHRVVSHECMCCSSLVRRECEVGAGRTRLVARVADWTVIKADPRKDQ